MEEEVLWVEKQERSIMISESSGDYKKKIGASPIFHVDFFIKSSASNKRPSAVEGTIPATGVVQKLSLPERGGGGRIPGADATERRNAAAT